MTKKPKRVSLSWFLEDMKRYKGAIVEILCIALLLRLLTIVIPFSFQVIIDKIIPYSRYYSLYFMLGLFFAVALVQAYFSFTNFITTQYLSIKLVRRYANKFYLHLFCLAPQWHYAWRSGDILARVNEMRTIQKFITSVIFGTSLDILFVTFYVAILFMINVKLTFIFLAILPIQLFVFFITGPLLRSRVQESFQARANLESIIVENITTVETLKALRLEDMALKRFNKPFDDSVRTSFRLSFLRHILGQILRIISSVREALVIIFGAFFIFKGELTVGTLIAFYLLSEQVVAPLQGIAGLWESFQHVRVSRKRLGDILIEETEDLSTASLPAVKSDFVFDAQNITYSWDEKTPIFEDLNLQIEKQKFVGIYGPSGVGKTTLAKVMAGLLPLSGGELFYYGNNINILPVGTYRRNAVYVPAKSDIFRGTVLQNLNPYGFDYKEEDYDNVLKMIDAEFLKELPNSLQTIIGEGALSLSTGQQQRLIIARAVLSKAKTLIFDEPTAALDEKSSHHVMSSLKALCKKEGYSLFVITHDKDMRPYFEQEINLDKGKKGEE